MDENQLQLLWEAHAKNGGFKNFDEFKSLMQDSNSRKAYFDNFNNELGFKDFNEYETLLGVKKKEPSLQDLQAASQKIGGVAQPIKKAVEKKEPTSYQSYQQPSKLPSQTTGFKTGQTVGQRKLQKGTKQYKQVLDNIAGINKLPNGQFTFKDVEYEKNVLGQQPSEQIAPSLEEKQRIIEGTYPEKLKEKEAARKEIEQKAIRNTAIRALQTKGIDINNTVALNDEIKRLTDEVNSGDATVRTVNGQLGLKKVLGGWEAFKTKFNEAVNGNQEAEDFVNKMTDEERVKYVEEMPQQDREYLGNTTNNIFSSVSGLVGENVPFLTKAAAGATIGAGLAALAPETGGLSLTALPTATSFLLTTPDMVNSGAKNEIIRRYEILKKQYPNEDKTKLMQMASDNGAIVGGIEGLVTNAIFMGNGGKVLTAPVREDALNTLGSYLKESVKGGVHMGATIAATNAIKEGIGAAQGYDVTPQEVMEHTIESGVENFKVGTLLNLVLGAPKVGGKLISSLVKNAIVKSAPLEEVRQALQENENANIIPQGTTEKTMQDLLEYKNALDKVPENLPQDVQASVAGLMQKRTKLEQEKASKDEAFHKDYDEQIDAINNQIEKIVETGDVKAFEVNKTTGNTYKQDIEQSAIEEPQAPKIEGKPEEISQPIELSTEETIPNVEDKKAEIERRRQEVTLESVAEVSKNVFVDGLELSEIQIKDNQVDTTIKKDGKTVGFLLLKIVNGNITVKVVEVFEEFQKQGIAEKIYIELNNRLKNNGLGTLHSDNEFLKDTKSEQWTLDGKVLSKEEKKAITDDIDRLIELEEAGRLGKTKAIQPAIKLWEKLVKKGFAEKTENGTYRFKYDAELKAVESLLSKEQTPPALRDVESTAKALVGVDLPNIFVSENKGGILNRENYYRIAQEKFQESKGLTTEEIFDKNKQKEQFKTEKGRLAFQKEFEKFAENADNKKKILAEAYHKAKKDGSNPELVKAVEDLLGKPKTENAPTTTEVRESIQPTIEEPKGQEPKESVPTSAESISEGTTETTPTVLESVKGSIDDIKLPMAKKVLEQAINSGDEATVNEYLKDISDQWHDEGTRTQTERDFGNVAKLAIEKFPQESQEALKIEETQPETKPTEEQPTEPKILNKEERIRKLSQRTLESENASEEGKKLIREHGITYEYKNREEAKTIADDIINVNGVDEAYKIAKEKDLHPYVNSILLGKIINKYVDAEIAATQKGDIKEAERAASMWAEVNDFYSREATVGGQFNAAIAEFIKDSPLGFIQKVKEANEANFEKVFKENNKDFKKAYEILTSTEEGKKFIKEEVEKLRKEERKEERKRKDKVIDNFFNNVLKDLEGNTYSTLPFAPQALKAIIEAARVATKAGDRIIDVVKSTIEKLDELANGKEWDKDRFAKYLENGIKETLKEKSEPLSMVDSLKKRIDELERRINEKDFSAEEYKEKKTLSEKEQEALKQYNETKKKYNEAKKESKEWQEKQEKRYIDRMKLKMANLTEEQKEQVIRRSLRRLAENDALTYDEFKDIVAKVLGVKELSKEEVAEINNLVKIKNEFPNVVKDYVDGKINEKDFAEKQTQTAEASLKLSAIENRTQYDILRTVRSISTGTILSGISLIRNIVQSTNMGMFVTAPIDIIKQGMDMVQYSGKYLAYKSGVLKKEPKLNKNLFLRFKGGVTQFKRALPITLWNFMKGTNQLDAIGNTEYRSSLSPIQAAKDLELHKEGKINLSKAALLERKLRRTYMARYADFTLRAMSSGDTPFRWFGEGKAAAEIAATSLGITDKTELKKFFTQPREYAKKVLIEKMGLDAKEASELADRYTELIIQAGKEETLQEDTIISKIADTIEEKAKTTNKDNFGMKLFKTAALGAKTFYSPFIKTPASYMWVAFKLSHPEIALGQSLVQYEQMRRSLRDNNTSEYIKYKSQFERSLAQAIWGVSLGIAASTLVKSGFVRGASDEDDSKREKQGKEYYDYGNEVNIGAMFGGSDFWVGTGYLSVLGVVLDTEAKKYEFKKKKELESSDQNAIEEYLDLLSVTTKSSLNSLILDQATNAMTALTDMNNFAQQTGTKLWDRSMTVFMPQDVRNISKYVLPEKPRLQADKIYQTVLNNEIQKNILVRWGANLMGYKLKSKIGIWGEPIGQDNSPLGVVKNMFGVESGNDKFGAILAEDALKDGNPKYFPTAPSRKMSIGGIELNFDNIEESTKEEQPQEGETKEIKKYDKMIVNQKEIELSLDDWDKRKMRVGKLRKIMVGALLSDSVGVMPQIQKNISKDAIKSNKIVYSKLTSPEKLYVLNFIYDISSKLGDKLFLINDFYPNHPEYLKETDFNKKDENRLNEVVDFLGDAINKTAVELEAEMNKKY